MNQEPVPNSAHTESAPPKSNMSAEQQPQGRIDQLRGLLGNLSIRRPSTVEQQETDGLPQFPLEQIALEAFIKVFPLPEKPGNPDEVAKAAEKVATMERIIKTFYAQEMSNTAIFTDPQGASLPYTKINVAELARAVAGTPEPDPSQEQGQASPKHHRFFVTPSIPFLKMGHQFTFVEVAFKEMMTYLPGAVEDLKAGIIPQDVEIFTLGSPTNQKWGQVIGAYVDRLHRNAYRTLGETYALLAQQHLPQTLQERAKTGVIFFGQSESSSLAVSTAESLISSGNATQDSRGRKQGKPYVQVLIDAPVSLNPSKSRKWQIVRGYVFDSLHSTLTSSHIRKSASGEAGFLNKVARVLEKRGIETHESEQDLALKTEARKAISGEMFHKEMPLDASKIKVNIRRGTRDRTIPQREFAKIAKKKRAEVVARESIEYPHHLDKQPGQEIAPPLPPNYVPIHGRQRQFQPGALGMDFVRDPQLDILNNSQSGRVREAAVEGTHIFSVIFSKHVVEKWGGGVDRIQKAIANQSSPS